MNICPKCGTQFADDGTFCPTCGTPVAQNNAYAQGYAAQPGAYDQPVAAVDPKNHTAEYDATDISDNKLIAVLAYFGIIGVIAAAIINRDSKFVMFHIRQSIKLFILQILLTICCILIITIPIVGICEVILFVVQIIGAVYAIQGKAKELPIVSSFGFLK